MDSSNIPFQTGCTSWKQILLWLMMSQDNKAYLEYTIKTNLTNLRNIHRQAKRKLHITNNGLNAKEIEKFPSLVKGKNFFYFTTVRHPFDR